MLIYQMPQHRHSSKVTENICSLNSQDRGYLAGTLKINSITGKLILAKKITSFVEGQGE